MRHANAHFGLDPILDRHRALPLLHHGIPDGELPFSPPLLRDQAGAAAAAAADADAAQVTARVGVGVGVGFGVRVDLGACVGPKLMLLLLVSSSDRARARRRDIPDRVDDFVPFRRIQPEHVGEPVARLPLDGDGGELRGELDADFAPVLCGGEERADHAF